MWLAVTNETDRLNEIDRLVQAFILQDKKLEECLSHLEELVTQMRKDSFTENNDSGIGLKKSLSTQNRSVLHNKASQ
jgi:hypothetical protein